MSGQRISINKIAKIIEGRRAVCLDAAKRHDAERQPHLAASERCAAMELSYVLSKILPSDEAKA
jgi:hypothetical protein